MQNKSYSVTFTWIALTHFDLEFCDYGLSPVRYRTITWANADLSPIGPLWINFGSKIWIILEDGCITGYLLQEHTIAYWGKNNSIHMVTEITYGVITNTNVNIWSDNLKFVRNGALKIYSVFYVVILYPFGLDGTARNQYSRRPLKSAPTTVIRCYSPQPITDSNKYTSWLQYMPHRAIYRYQDHLSVLKQCRPCHTRAINTLWPGQMAAISQMTFSNAFSWMKIYEFRLRFYRNLFLRFQLTTFQHWFRFCRWHHTCGWFSLQWRHNDRNGVSNHQHHDC